MREESVARCTGCGAGSAQTWLSGEGPLCDGCVNRRVSAATGWPDLPKPPSPFEITGPDGRTHVIRLRLVRMPGGICAEAVEENCETGAGYRTSVVGAHDAATGPLLDQVRRRVADLISRPWLAIAPVGRGGGVELLGDEVQGRVEGDVHGGPPRVVVDGRLMTWEELGDLVTSWEGWGFSLQWREA